MLLVDLENGALSFVLEVQSVMDSVTIPWQLVANTESQAPFCPTASVSLG